TRRVASSSSAAPIQPPRRSNSAGAEGALAQTPAHAAGRLPLAVRSRSSLASPAGKCTSQPATVMTTPPYARAVRSRGSQVNRGARAPGRSRRNGGRVDPRGSRRPETLDNLTVGARIDQAHRADHERGVVGTVVPDRAHHAGGDPDCAAGADVHD